ncbi:MAG: anion permease [Peptococcaceae bacterium]|nr:anion permease [Peptococcaceae bacterium]
MTLDRSKLIKYFIVFGLPLIFLVIPKGDVYTREMAITLAATFCFLAWAAVELTNLLIPSLLWPAVLVLSGAVTYSDVYSAWGDSTVFGVLSIYILSLALNRVGLLKRIAFTVAKFFGGSFIGTAFSVFFATCAVSLVTFVSSETVIAAITFGAVMAFGLAHTRAGAVLMMAGMLGGVTMRMVMYYPFFVKLMDKNVQAIDPSFALTPMDFIVYNWPTVIFCIGFLLLLIKLFVKPEEVAHLNGREYYVTELAKMGKITKEEKAGIIALLFIIIFIATSFVHGLDYMYSFVIAIAGMFLLGFATEEDIKATPFDTVVFFASCMTIGSVCSAAGITAAVTSLLTPMFQGLSSFATLGLTVVFGTVLNFCMTPAAMLAGFTTMIYELFLNLGLNPMAGLMAFYQSTDLVFLPYEFLYFLYFFTYGIMSMKDFVIMHTLKTVLTIVFFLAIIVPYWMLVGLI